MGESHRNRTSARGSRRGKEDWEQPCCCCGCYCADEVTRDTQCCGCCPIKCGVFTVAVLTLGLTIAVLLSICLQFQNEHFSFWFSVMCLICSAPLFVASAFFISFFTSNSKTTRKLLGPACILVGGGVLLLMLWHIVYVSWIYSEEDVMVGEGDIEESSNYER